MAVPLRNLILLCLFLNITSCAKILGIFPSPGYSQFILGEKLMLELVNRGHEVTVISPFTSSKKVDNYTVVHVSGLVDNVMKELDLFDLHEVNGFSRMYRSYTRIGLPMTEYILAHPNVQSLLKSDATFDLVLVEILWNDAHVGFARHYGAPLITFSSIGTSPWASDLVANPLHPGYMSHLSAGFSNEMTIAERAWNLAFHAYELYLRHLVMLPKQNEFLQKYFSNMPHLSEIMYDTSVMLLNSHPSYKEPVPLVPSMIEIGGFHIEPEDIPSDIEKFMDNATDGVIYFSMGSNLKSTSMPKSIKNEIFESFSKLKQKVVWKFEDISLSNIPDNVLIKNWLPQRGILGHPNTKVFISHCGLSSTIEAVHYGVPLLCIPIFADQKMNTAVNIKSGIAVYLPYKKLSSNTLSEALNQLLRNTSYVRQMKKRSSWMRDRLVNPMSTAMYWIEFVIRHGGAPHLRIAALSLRWYEYFYLDILFYILLIIGVVYILLIQVKKTLVVNGNIDTLDKKRRPKQQ